MQDRNITKPPMTLAPEAFASGMILKFPPSRQYVPPAYGSVRRFFRFVPRYILRHAYRSAKRSALTMLIALLLFIAVGQFNLLKQSYGDLCESIEVTASFVGGVRLSSVTQLINTQLVTEAYYQGAATVGVNFNETSVILTNDITRYTGEDVAIEYAEGFDPSRIGTTGDIILVGDAYGASFDLAPGDAVQIISPTLFLEKVRQYIDDKRPDYPYEEYSSDELLAMFRTGIVGDIGVQMRECTVAGIVSSPSGKYSMAVFSPGMNTSTVGIGTNAVLDIAEFRLSHYHFGDELRRYGENIVHGSASGSTDFVMDMGKLKGPMDTLNLLKSLYPAIAAAAAIIAGFLCCLVILQSSKEASIMRVSGATKRKTAAVLVLEQFMLSVAGLALGFCVMLICNYSGTVETFAQMLIYAALYIVVALAAAITCSVFVSRRSPLELLQVKE